MENSTTEAATALDLSVGSSNRANGAAAKEGDNAYSPEVGDIVTLVEEDLFCQDSLRLLPGQ